MQQLNPNLIVISPGDPLQEVYGDYIKIYLSGTLDLSTDKVPWQQRFVNGLNKLMTDTKTPLPEGLPDIRQMKFLIMNPLMPTQGTPTLDNEAFVQKMQWELSCYDVADVIFCNYLRKSGAMQSLQGFLLNSMTGKVIARCPVDSPLYGTVKLIGQAKNIPVVGDSASLIVILNQMFQFIPKLNELANYGVGE